MKNFPQSFEPVGSDSILEQFIQLKNYVNDALSMFEDNVNEIIDSNDFVQTKIQNLTNEQKAQARENIGAGASTINIVDNLDSESSIDALSANQGHVLQGLFAQLNTKVEENTETIDGHTINISSLNQQVEENTETIDGHTINISSLNQQSARALKTPIDAPTSTELVAIDDNNTQIGLSIGNGFEINNNILIEKTKVIFEGSFAITNGAILSLNIPENAKMLIFIFAESTTCRGGYDFDMSKNDGTFSNLHVQSNGNCILKTGNISRNSGDFTFSNLRETTNFGDRSSVTNLYLNIVKVVALW